MDMACSVGALNSNQFHFITMPEFFAIWCPPRSRRTNSSITLQRFRSSLLLFLVIPTLLFGLYFGPLVELAKCIQCKHVVFVKFLMYFYYERLSKTMKRRLCLWHVYLFVCWDFIRLATIEKRWNLQLRESLDQQTLDILLVDDDEFFAEIVAGQLQDELQHRVTIARSGRQRRNYLKTALILIFDYHFSRITICRRWTVLNLFSGCR